MSAEQKNLIEQIFESQIVKLVAVASIVIGVVVWQYTQMIIPIGEINAKLTTISEKLDEHITNSVLTDRTQTEHISVLTRNQDRVCDKVQLSCLKIP